jgi:hypothetical protein
MGWSATTLREVTDVVREINDSAASFKAGDPRLRYGFTTV